MTAASISVDTALLGLLGALVGLAISGVGAAMLQTTRRLGSREDLVQIALDQSTLEQSSRAALERDRMLLVLEERRQRWIVLSAGAYVGLTVLVGIAVGVATSNTGVISITGGLLLAVALMLAFFELGRSRRVNPNSLYYFEDLELGEFGREWRMLRDCVESWLQRDGWTIESGRRDADIVGTRDDQQILVELRTRKARGRRIDRIIERTATSWRSGEPRPIRWAVVSSTDAPPLSKDELDELAVLGVEVYEASNGTVSRRLRASHKAETERE